MQLDLNKLTPWNLEANTSIFLGDMSVNPRTLHSITFTEIASRHKSPTLGVTLDSIMDNVKKTNKFLKVSSYGTSQKPLRPDLSDIEVSLIHAIKGNIPDEVMAETLNITLIRLKQIRRATEHMYRRHDTPLPSLPLITITDTSRYWTEDELKETYGELPELSTNITDIKTYKDLLRRIEGQSQYLNFPVNAKLYSEEDNKNSILNGDTLPSEVPEKDKEGYRELSDKLWSYVSREDSISGPLLHFNWRGNDNVRLSVEEIELPYIEVNLEYLSTVTVKEFNEYTTKTLEHQHMEGGYNAPIKIPKAIIKLSVDIINTFINREISPPALENLVIYMVASPEYTAKQLGITINPTSFYRGHSCNVRDKNKHVNYIINTPPLINPKFSSDTHGYGVICHKCNTFLTLENNSINQCPHMIFDIFYKPTSNYKNTPLVYLYQKEDIPIDYSLYYYTKDTFGFISSVFTLNLLQFYSNFSLPIHKVPYEF